MAEPPFSGLEGSLGGARRRGAGIGRYFRRSGAPGVFSEFRGIRKENVLWCPGNIEIRGRF